jgi:hypothetical protein
MPATITTLWVGSMEGMLEQDLLIDGSPEPFAAGDYYLRHATASLSAMATLAALLTGTGIAGVAVELLENLYVRISATPAFAITWTDTGLRDMLGFTGNLAGLNSYTAPRRSPYLWSAGWPAELATPSGVGSYDDEDAVVRPSADGTDQELDHFVTHRLQEASYDVVPLSRYMLQDSALADGLNWRTFRRQVLVANARFQLYELITEDMASTDPITWVDPLGTYLVRELPPGVNPRKIPHANTYWRVEAKLREVDEY